MLILLLIIAFGAGFGAGFFLKLKQKTKTRSDIEASLKNALVIPAAPAQGPGEEELLQKMRADTIEKKILYEEQLSLIFRMGKEMFSNISFDNIARSIAEGANKIIQAEICTVLLEDKSSGYIIPFYSQGVPKEYLDKMRYKRGESISGWVMANNQVFFDNNIASNKWLQDQNKGEYFVNSLLSMPLAIKDKVIGVLNLSNKKSSQAFHADEIEFTRGLVTEASIALQNATLYDQIQESYLRTITALAFALDARDAYTKQHSENVTNYSVAIAQELNLKPYQIEQIRRAGLLHDIGKIGIRDGVLLKPSKLNDEEYNDIKRHTVKGEAIVSALPFLKEEAKLIRQHHEQFDGSGYPDGLRGFAIELGARILAVSDSLDAMLTDRVYRKALGIEAASAELKKFSSKQFDPEIVEAVLRLIQKRPEIFSPTK